MFRNRPPLDKGVLFCYSRFMSDKLAVFLVIVVLALGIGGAWYDGNHKDDQWRVYAESHHCRRIGKSTTDRIGEGTGNGDVYTPSQVVYACDNNEIREYVR